MCYAVPGTTHVASEDWVGGVGVNLAGGAVGRETPVEVLHGAE